MKRFQQLGRGTSLVNNLGEFTIPSYEGPTGLPTKIKYPNGQRTEIDYYGNSEDRRLHRIRNLDQDRQWGQAMGSRLDK